MDKKISVLAFDLGNVVLKISLIPVIEKISEITGYDKNQVQRCLALNKDFIKYEKGLMATGEYRDYFSKLFDFSFSIDEFESLWNAMFLGVCPGIEDVLQVIPTDFHVFALSNTNELHTLKWRSDYAQVLTRFEAFYLSYELKCRKPEKEIFTAFLDRVGVDPGCVLFFDDMKENVKAAESLGIASVLIHSTDDIVAALQDKSII